MTILVISAMIPGVAASEEHYSGTGWTLILYEDPIINPQTGNPYESMGDFYQATNPAYWESLSMIDQNRLSREPAVLPGLTLAISRTEEQQAMAMDLAGQTMTKADSRAWMRAWWFRLLGLAFLGVAVAGGYWWRVHQVRVQNRKLAHKVAQQTADLRREIEQRRLAEAALSRKAAEEADGAPRADVPAKDVVEEEAPEMEPAAETPEPEVAPVEDTTPVEEEAVEEPVEDVVSAKLVTGRQLSAFWIRLRKLGLPDLAAMRREHRRTEEERVANALAEVASDLNETREQLTALGQAREDHPCHTCEVRKEHRDNLRRVDNLEKERALLEGVLERETDSEEARIRGVIRGIREVLNRFGYLYRGYPSEKADMLASVFDNDALILCEMVDRGVLDNLPPEDLAEVFSWFSFDRDSRYANHFTLSRELIALRRRLADIERAVLGEERDNGLYISEGHNPNFYGPAKAWTLGQTMVEICEQIELSEGDLVMTFNKTIDLLRQVGEMLQSVNPEHSLRNRLRQAEALLKRDIVEHSLVLGFAPIELPEIARAELEAAIEADEDEGHVHGPGCGHDHHDHAPKAKKAAAKKPATAKEAEPAKAEKAAKPAAKKAAAPKAEAKPVAKKAPAKKAK